jgi:flagellar biogenesis protein FliO
MNTASQLEHLAATRVKPQSLPSIGAWFQALMIKTRTALRWIMQRARAQQARRNLRVCENVSLGEKRFVAIVQVDEERFLIGGSSSSVSLLTRLQETKTFAAALDQEAAKIS